MAHARIAEMAAYHIDKIRSVQPQGPYLVGGMCAGGVIAFEIALQLQRQGGKSRPWSPCSTRPTRKHRSRPGASPASDFAALPRLSTRRQSIRFGRRVRDRS